MHRAIGRRCNRQRNGGKANAGQLAGGTSLRRELSPHSVGNAVDKPQISGVSH